MPRLFIAFHVTPTDPLRRTLRALQKMGGRVRPVAADQMHLTLRFLGECEVEWIRTIADALQPAVESSAPIATRWLGLGQFPPLREDGSAPSPRVIFARPDRSATERLSTLAASLEEQLIARLPQLQPDKHGFNAHLTLARVKPPRRGKNRRRRSSEQSSDPLAPVRQLLADNRESDLGETVLDRIELIESELTPNGPIYTTLQQAELKGFDREGMK